MKGREVRVVAVLARREEGAARRRSLRISEGDGEAEGKNNQRLSATAGSTRPDTETEPVWARCRGGGRLCPCLAL